MGPPGYPANPDWDSGYRYNSSGVAHAFSAFGLGGNEIRFPVFSATKQSSVVSPAEMMALGDPLTRSPEPERDGSYDPTVMEFRPQPIGGVLGGYVGDGDARTGTVYRNHRSRYNRFVCDGHVEIEDCNKPFPDNDAYLARWNIDHEPHRELWKW
jgi:hypothetical protein